MAGGRWARQSYYEAIFALASSIFEDAECYMALKFHLQRVRHHKESDPIPQPREEPKLKIDYDYNIDSDDHSKKLLKAIRLARQKIEIADRQGNAIIRQLATNEIAVKGRDKYKLAIDAYLEAFNACARVHDIDKLAFHSDWFREFYQRNYDALMIKSVYDNVIANTDKVRYW
jgi:hypothetical protein